MPIDIKEFEEGSDESESLTTAELIVKFLLDNRDKAFRRKEIAQAIDTNPNAVGTNLSRLKDRGLVRHRKQHWALTNDLDRLNDALRASTLFGQLRSEYGAIIEDGEDAQAWADAQPDEPHPSDQETSSPDSEPADSESAQ
jgi:transcription initiation factor IIE alpha subunit